MKVRVIDKPCLFAETVYLLYYYINGIAYTRDYERVNRKFGRYLLEKEDQGLQLAQELDRISAAVTQTLDPHQARLRYFFEKLPGTDEKTCCCLAHTMLVATPLNCTDIDSFAAELLRMFRYMSGIGFKINDMNTMGLVLEPLDPQEEPEPLQVQLERLPCSMEARWEILRRLSEALMGRIDRNYRFIVSFNLMLIILGVTGVIQPTLSALLHNMSTLGISLRSMTNLLPEKTEQSNA